MLHVVEVILMVSRRNRTMEFIWSYVQLLASVFLLEVIVEFIGTAILSFFGMSPPHIGSYITKSLVMLIVVTPFFSLWFLRYHWQVWSAKQDTEVSRQRYRSLFEYNPDAIFAVDLTGRIVSANPQCLSLMGYSTDALLGIYHQTLFEPGEGHIVQQHFEEAKQGHSQVNRLTLLHEAGHPVPAIVTSIPIYVNQEVVGMHLVLQDVSNQERLAGELRGVKNTLESFINNSADAIMVTSLEDKVLLVNPAWEHLYGWSAAEVIGTVVSVAPVHLQEQLRQGLQTVKSGGKITGLETVRQTRDGTLVDVSVTVSPVRDAYGKVIAVAAIIRNITERKKTEELLRRSEKLAIAGQLAAGVAHEIRNPLTSIKGFLQLYQSAHEPRLPYLDIVMSEIGRIESIIGEFLMVAKPQVSQQETLDLHDLLKSVIEILDTRAILNSVQIQMMPTSKPILIDGDVNQLKQVFVNLIKNAIEAMPTGGEVHVEIYDAQVDGARVYIRDNGPGIPPEHVKRLGEPFYTTKSTGTGLGLMVSRQIIVNHRGYLDFKSEMGMGTIAEVVFPRAFQGV